MLEELRLLKELQDLDKERQTLDEQRKQFVTEQSLLQAELDRVQAMVDSLAGEIAGLQEQRQELTASFAQEQENIVRSEGRLPQIKTQKEYVAVLKEIDTAKKLAKELQDQIDLKDRDLTTLEGDKAEKDAELGGLAATVEARRSEITETVTELETSLGGMSGQRDGLLKQLPVALRKRYELLFARRGGMAVVEARGGACLGCNMHLPPQLFNSLYVVTEVQACPHCNRLLYIVDQG